MSVEKITLKLSAAAHTNDWLGRADEHGDTTTVLEHTARTVTLELTEAALADLISDATYYAEEMGPDNTGDLDYRPRAKACLRALARAGVAWERRGFAVTVTEVPA